MNFWTLSRLRFSGTEERTLADWGLAEPRLELVSLAPDVLTLPVAVDDFTAAPEFEAGDRVQLFLRPSDPADPASPDWTSGTKRFDGVLVGAADRSATGEAESLSLTAHGPWAYLDTIYHQQWSYGWTTDVVLFSSTDGLTTISAGAQIEAALQWLLTLDATLFQLASPVEPAALNVPLQPARDITVAEVIRVCLEKAPDVVSWFDYSTTPPTLHFARRADLVSVTLALAADVSAVKLQARADLVRTAVQLNFKRTTTVDGESRVESLAYPGTIQVAPAAAWDSVNARLKSEYLLRNALVQTVDLTGPSITTVQASIVSDLTLLASPDWWEERKPDLGQLLTDAGTRAWSFLPGQSGLSVAVTDRDTGEELALDGNENYVVGLPFELLDGQPAEWITLPGGAPPAWRRVRIYVSYSWTRAADQGTEVDHYDTTLTNVPSGAYSAPASLAFGEAIPAGLADYVLSTLNPAPWEGSVTIAEDECGDTLRPGLALNLSGGDAAWLTMSALVQRVTLDIARGHTTVELGLPRYLGAAEVVDFMRFSRVRRLWTNPLVRGDAAAGNSTSIGMGASGPNQNSAVSQPSLTQLRVGTASSHVTLANSPTSVLRQTFQGAEKILLDSSVIPDGKKAEFRRASVCVDNGDGTSTNATVYVLMTAP